MIFLISQMKTYVVTPSLEQTRRDGSNDGPKHKFKRRNMENYP